MSYSMGLGATEPVKVVGSVCKPTDVSTLGKFKDLQRQINRIAAVKHYTQITVDGDLGPGTVSAYNKVMGTAMSTCSQLATGVSSSIWLALSLVTAAANSLNAPPPPAPKPSRPVVKPDGTVAETLPEEPPMLDRVMNFATSPMGLLAGAGIVGFFVWRARGKGSRSAAPVSPFSAAV